MTAPVLPASLLYGHISFYALAVVVDGSDPDREPDAQVPTNMVIKFTPSASRVLVPAVTPIALTLFPKQIACTLDPLTGIMIDPQGAEGVELLATGVAAMNPNDFTWLVTISGDDITTYSFPIDVPAGVTTDLTLATAVPASGGTFITVGQTGLSAYDSAVRNGFTGDLSAWLVSLVSTVPGPVGLVWRDAWSNGTAYSINDAVSDDDSSWIATVANTGHRPSTDGGARWDLLAKAGVDGTGTVIEVNGVSPDVGGNVTWLPSWTQVSDKPEFIGAGSTAANARAAIGAGTGNGTSNLAIGTTTGTAADGATVATNTGGAREKTAALSATSGTCTGNLANASIFTISPTGNWTLALTNIPASPWGVTVTVLVYEGGTPRTMTQPSGTIHSMGAALPASVASKIRAYTYITKDGGSNWVVSATVEQ